MFPVDHPNRADQRDRVRGQGVQGGRPSGRSVALRLTGLQAISNRDLINAGIPKRCLS